MKVLSHSLYPTFCDPRDYNLPGSSVNGISQARILEGVAIPFPRASSQARHWTQVSCLWGRFFTVWTTREAQYMRRLTIIFPSLFLHLVYLEIFISIQDINLISLYLYVRPLSGNSHIKLLSWFSTFNIFHIYKFDFLLYRNGFNIFGFLNRNVFIIQILFRLFGWLFSLQMAFYYMFLFLLIFLIVILR